MNILKQQSANWQTTLIDKPIVFSEKNSEKKVTQLAGDDYVQKSSVKGVNLMDNWKLLLQAGSGHYNISPRVDDYIVVPVAIVPTEIPNLNGFAMPLEELTAFVPHRKQLAYQTWAGCPTHENHEADNPRNAKGIVVDSVLKKSPFESIWYMTQLLAFDKTKDPTLCEKILDDNQNSYSMGCTAQWYMCSVTGKNINDSPYFPTNNPNQPVYLTTGRKGEAPNQLVYAKGIGITGEETSSVGVPAWRTAITPNTHVREI